MVTVLPKYWLERKTMTRWVGRSDDPADLVPMGEWKLERDIDDVRRNGIFTGPFYMERIE